MVLDLHSNIEFFVLSRGFYTLMFLPILLRGTAVLLPKLLIEIGRILVPSPENDLIHRLSRIFQHCRHINEAVVLNHLLKRIPRVFLQHAGKIIGIHIEHLRHRLQRAVPVVGLDIFHDRHTFSFSQIQLGSHQIRVIDLHQLQKNQIHQIVDYIHRTLRRRAQKFNDQFLHEKLNPGASLRMKQDKVIMDFLLGNRIQQKL